MPNEPVKRIGLVDFIKAIKRELVEAQQNAGADALLRLDDVELEISFVTSQEGTAGLKFWIVDLGGKYSKEKTHKVTLKLAPITHINLVVPKTDLKGVELTVDSPQLGKEEKKE